jgi:hypothetical protein
MTTPALKDVWEAHDSLVQLRQLAVRLHRSPATAPHDAATSAALVDYLMRKCAHAEQRFASLRQQAHTRDDQVAPPGAFLTFLSNALSGGGGSLHHGSSLGGSFAGGDDATDALSAFDGAAADDAATGATVVDAVWPTDDDHAAGVGGGGAGAAGVGVGGSAGVGGTRMLSTDEVEQLLAFFHADASRSVALVRSQAAVRGFLARQRFREIRKKARQRVNIVDEILKTETAFMSSLSITCEQFLAPIRASGALTENEVGVVFGNIEQILGFSRELHAALAARLKTITALSCVGDVFVQFVPYMKVFNEYCKNYDRCSAFLKESGKNATSPFNNICNAATDAGNLNLSSYLIMPVQRMPRYRLLLADLRDKTWPAHADFEALERALDGVSRAATGVNAFLKANDGAAKVIWMEKTIKGVGDLVTPTRIFVKEGVLGVRTATSSTSKMRCFLCNDVLVVATNEKNPACKYRLPLEQLTIVDVEDMQLIQNAFSVIGNEASLTIVCANSGEKTYWMSDLKRAINELVADESDGDAAAAGGALGDGGGSGGGGGGGGGSGIGIGIAGGGGDDAAAAGGASQAAGTSARFALRRPTRQVSGYRVNVVGTETRVAAKEYTVYVINVVDQANGRDFNIFRRFSDFDDLYATLTKKKLPNLPLLPKKQIFSSMSAKVMETRKIGLGTFLQQLALREGLIDSDGDLRAFLELDVPRSKQEEQLITVFLLDNSKKAFKVKPLLRSSELCAMMASKLRLSDAEARTFAVFVVTDETERALQPDDHPLDVLASWSGQSRLVYRKAIFRRVDIDGAPTNDAHRHLLYIEAVSNVLGGVYPTDDAEALQLAALHCAVQFGRATGQTINLVGLVDGYIPARLLKRRAPAQWESDILHAHRSLSEADAGNAENAYLARVRTRPYYGARFFHNVEPMGIAVMPSLVKLMVRVDGVGVLDERMTQLAFLEIASIKVSSTPKTIAFAQSVKEWKFKTREGFAIEQCIKSHATI